MAVTDNSSLYNFVAVQDGNAIDLDVVAGTTAVSSVLSSGNHVGLGAAGVLDSLTIGGGSADMNTVINALGHLSTDKQVSDAVKQTLPLIVGGMSQANLGALHNGNAIIQGHHGASGGDGYLSNQNGWFKPFGSWADQNSQNGISGYNSRTSGLAIGADGDLDSVNRVGLALVYATTQVTGNDSAAPQSGKLDSYQVALYGSHSLTDVTEVSFQGDLGYNDNTGHRTINFGGLNRQAAADYASLSAHFGASLGQTIQQDERTTFIPSLRADYSYIQANGYTENGAGALNLKVASQAAAEFILGADGKVNYALDTGKTLTANLGLGYDLFAKHNSLTASYVGGGAAFSTTGIDVKPLVLKGGIGYGMSTSKTMEISARFDIEARQGFTNQTASIKMRMPF